MPIIGENIGPLQPFESRRSEHVRKVIFLNPDRDPKNLFQEELWDISKFERKNLPVVLGEIKSKEVFSEQKEIRVLDMPIYIPGKGWAIPPEMEQFREVIDMTLEHESIVNPNVKDYFTYITVDQKRVVPRKSQRRPGWHSDAYITDETGLQVDVTAENKKHIEKQGGRLVDRTYVISDRLPTWFLEGPFPIKVDPKDCEKVLQTFDQTAEGKTPTIYPDYTLLRLDPYDVHASAPNPSNETLDRTFVKISFSKQVFNRDTNTINPLFDYRWTLVPRDRNKREHRNYVIGYDREDRDRYTAVDPQILVKKSLREIEWVIPKVFLAKKVEGVRIEPAVVGEKLETVVNNFLVTINVAREGDLRIETSQGDKYFISEKQRRYRYSPKPNKDGLYLPDGKPRKMVEVKQNVRFIAPWGAMEYLPKGGVMDISNRYDIYGIHPDNYKASFQKI